MKTVDSKRSYAERMEMINPRIELCRKASDRTRNLLFLIAGLCGLIFVSYVNTSSGSWTNERLESYSKLESMLLDLDKELPTSAHRYKFEDPQNWPNVKNNPSLKELLVSKHIHTVEQFKILVAEAEKESSSQNIAVLPVVGLKFDVNDLGILGTGMLLFLSVVLSSAAARELYNLEETFDQASSNQVLKETYDLLSMGEFLHFSGSTVKRSLALDRLKDFACVLFALPAIASCLQLSYDLATAPAGALLSPTHTSTVIWIEGCLTICILAVSFVNILIGVATEACWKSAASKTGVEVTNLNIPTDLKALTAINYVSLFISAAVLGVNLASHLSVSTALVELSLILLVLVVLIYARGINFKTTQMQPEYARGVLLANVAMLAALAVIFLKHRDDIQLLRVCRFLTPLVLITSIGLATKLYWLNILKLFKK